MALRDRLRRKPQPDLARIIEEEVAKALSSTPYANSGASVANIPTAGGPGSAGGGQGLLQTPTVSATPLPRPADTFGAQLGPAHPLLPAPIDTQDPDTGRAIPRRWQYDVAWNLQLNSDRATPWSVLKALADQCDVIHRCIEIRISEMVGLDTSWTVTDSAVIEIMRREGVSHARAMELARDEHAEEISRLTDFWQSPYPHGDRHWSEWITEVLWQHFVLDAVAIYPRHNLGGEVIGLEVIDGATIKPLLDNRGDTPAPPSAAYQQILWGFPRGEYQTSAVSDGDYYSGPGEHGEYANDQLAYFTRNKRTWSPYGYSTVEECLPSAALYLERQTWMRSEYTDGTMPNTFMLTDSEMSPAQLPDWERVLNDNLAGQTQERRKIRMLPNGFRPDYAPLLEERYKSDYDEHLIKLIAAKFGVQPTQLGIIPTTGIGGRGQMEGEQDQAETMSKRPLEQWLASMVESLSRRFLGASRNVEFVLRAQGTTNQQAELADALKNQLYSGQKTLNAVQAELGQPLYEMPEADEPFIVAGSTVTFLRGLMATDSTGDTVGQIGTGVAAAREGATPVEPPSEPSIEEPPDGMTAAQETELKVFRAFIGKRRRTGRWRNFEFQTFDTVTAKALNAEGCKAVTGAEPSGEEVRKASPLGVVQSWTYQEHSV
jgi:hypothetical protein